MFIIGIFVQICSGHVWQQFSIGRFISGLGVGALSITIPMVSAFLLSFFFGRILICSVSSRDRSSSNPWYFYVGIHTSVTVYLTDVLLALVQPTNYLLHSASWWPVSAY